MGYITPLLDGDTPLLDTSNDEDFAEMLLRESAAARNGDRTRWKLGSRSGPGTRKRPRGRGELGDLSELSSDDSSQAITLRAVTKKPRTERPDPLRNTAPLERPTEGIRLLLNQQHEEIPIDAPPELEADDDGIEQDSDREDTIIPPSGKLFANYPWLPPTCETRSAADKYFAYPQEPPTQAVRIVADDGDLSGHEDIVEIFSAKGDTESSTDRSLGRLEEKLMGIEFGPRYDEVRSTENDQTIAWRASSLCPPAQCLPRHRRRHGLRHELKHGPAV